MERERDSGGGGGVHRDLMHGDGALGWLQREVVEIHTSKHDGAMFLEQFCFVGDDSDGFC